MFRTLVINILILVVFPSLLSCEMIPDPIVTDLPEEESVTMPAAIKITVSGKSLPVKIEDNVATRDLVAALRDASITFDAHDYGGFEKVGGLGRTLPSSDSQLTTQPGDVILYSGNQIVLFYGSNSWSYTRIGKIQYGTLDELKTFLQAGKGIISVTLSL